MVNVRGFGNCNRTMAGNGRLSSSKLAVRLHRWKPWDSPTGLRENGGVAKLEFVVVSVRLSADGDVEVITSKFVGTFRGSITDSPFGCGTFW